MKMLFGKRLKGIEGCLLMKMVVEILREDGGIEWWEEYKVLQRKFELDVGSVGGLKNKTRNEKNWEEEVCTKSTLKWYRLAEDGTRYRNM